MPAFIKPNSSRLWINFRFLENRKLEEITLRNTSSKAKTLSVITDPLDTKKGMTCRSSDLYVV
jgi:hypothetical protein